MDNKLISSKYKFNSAVAVAEVPEVATCWIEVN